MERYEAYKDSGIEWIGDIPAHWEAGKILRHARLESGHTPSKQHPEWWIEEECTVPWITTGDVHRFRDGALLDIDDTVEHVSQIGLENSSARLLPAGTVALSRTASVGFSVVLSAPMASSQDFADWVPDECLDSFYLLYSLRSMDLVFKQLQMGSTHKTIYMPDIMKLAIAYPPLDEQRAIVDYLTAKTAEVDALVADCEREVELLREYRKAVISEAVTKGLDPDAPMKDSGVEWIGEIPEGWDVLYPKKLFALRKERAHPDDVQLTASQKNGIVAQEEYMRLENQRVVQVITGDDILKHVEAGDFVISMRSFQGGLEYSTICGKISSAYVMLHAIDSTSVCNDYYKHLFKSEEYIQALQSTSNLVRDGQALRFANFIQVYLPIPSMQEQQAIARYLDVKTAEIDSLIEVKQRMVDKLREYRKSLISEAVTGKFKVPRVDR